MEVITSIITSTIVSGLIIGLFQTFSKYRADKNLETYKQELTKLTENFKFELQRKSQDFSLYTVKRHERYPELFRLILIADGTIRGLYGLRRVNTFEEFNKTDIKEYLEKKSIALGFIDQIVDQWDNDKDCAIEQLKDYLRNYEINNARISFHEAKNYYIFTELYLTDNVSQLIQEVLKHLGYILTAIEFPDPGASKARCEFEITLENLLNELRKEMKLELGRAFFEG